LIPYWGIQGTFWTNCIAAVDPSNRIATGSDRRNSTSVTAKGTLRRRRWVFGGGGPRGRERRGGEAPREPVRRTRWSMCSRGATPGISLHRSHGQIRNPTRIHAAASRDGAEVPN